MKKVSLSRGLAVIVIFAMVMCMFGCGETKQYESESMYEDTFSSSVFEEDSYQEEISEEEWYEEAVKEITLSEAINTKERSLWYAQDNYGGGVAKDAAFRILFVFEDGKMTFCENYAGLTFGDLDSLSDDEIIEKVKKAAEERVIEMLRERKRISSEWQYSTPEGEAVKERTLEIYNEMIEETEQAILNGKDTRAWFTEDIKLKIFTDNTGNATKRKSIYYKYFTDYLADKPEETAFSVYQQAFLTLYIILALPVIVVAVRIVGILSSLK